MQNRYVFRKKVWHSHRAVLRRRLIAVSAAIVITAVIAVVIYRDLNRSNQAESPTSQLGLQEISENAQTFSSPYFKFSDSGIWALKKDESSDQVYVYYKYRGLDIEHRLTVYVNQMPIPLYLASAWALPVRVVNNSSLDVTSVSGPCVQQYGQEDLHKVKTVSIAGAQMLCDPDSPQYTVVLAEIDGNYQLDMRRADGSPVSFVVLYRDMRLSTDSSTIERIARTFQAL